MTQAFEISKITYRRKTHDKGIILGMRPWRWTLGAKYSPVFAKDAETGETLSVCAPQKTNFAVYVPAAHLEAGRTLLLVNHEYRQPRIETTIRILEVNPQWIDAEVLECKEAPRPETRAAKRRKVVDYAPKTCETCVNEDDFVFGGRPAENDAPVESEDEWTAASISASGYLEDADALNYDEYEMSELDVLMADVIDDAPQAAAPNEEKEIYEENAENDAERAEIRRKASSMERAIRNSRDAAAARNFEVISRTRTAGMSVRTYQLQSIQHRGDNARIRRDKYAPPEIGERYDDQRIMAYSGWRPPAFRHDIGNETRRHYGQRPSEIHQCFVRQRILAEAGMRSRKNVLERVGGGSCRVQIITDAGDD